MEVDRLHVRLDADISGFRRGVAEATALMGRSGARMAAHVEATQAALAGLGDGLGGQAAQIGETLEGVARALSTTFGRAFDQILRTGEADIGRLISGLARDLARLGLRPVFDALGKQAGGLAGGLIGRAAGGPVAAGTAYLVGERGPELFVPPTPGRVVPAPASGLHVTVNVQAADAHSFLQSESQIVAMLSRAVIRGQRFRSS